MPKHILVIDDEQGFRDALHDVLVGAGYEVEASPYLASAVGSALLGTYDVVTLDLRMPGIDGLEIARLYRRLALLTPVVVISGYLSKAIVAQLQEIGIRHIIAKPAGVSEILAAIDSALSS